KFREGLEDLQGFSRIWLLSWLDRSDSYKLKVIPYRDTVERGLFATRAPRRPNPIGISPVKLISVDLENGIIHVNGIDLLNGTPIIDIKPYSHKFDSYPDVDSGWLDESISREAADDRFKEERI
ncbi:MAG: tRNA (N6-threonylcarbamoyladenosine(37)-N6)-methyltransferase TrmO, partial [Calditrichaeota bacterium]|nr:tRNA (N6-threonylcarbamoyladenosine(37)-N6)-methyltransferase TrmO [Calditrichota bacterium]